eukprot:Hpha_TRINITY_DN14963_c1_g3::TRINITY_DN14963_c1_g3_i1::g.143461::m.143461
MGAPPGMRERLARVSGQELKRRADETVEELVGATRRMRLDGDYRGALMRPHSRPCTREIRPVGGVKRAAVLAGLVIEELAGSCQRLRLSSPEPARDEEWDDDTRLEPEAVRSAVRDIPKPQQLVCLLWLMRLCEAALKDACSGQRVTPVGYTEECRVVANRLGITVRDGFGTTPPLWSPRKVDALFRASRLIASRVAQGLLPAPRGVSKPPGDIEATGQVGSPARGVATWDSVSPRVRAAAAEIHLQCRPREVSLVSINRTAEQVWAGERAKLLYDAADLPAVLVVHCVPLAHVNEFERISDGYHTYFCGPAREFGVAVFVNAKAFPGAKRTCAEGLPGGGRLLGVDLGAGLAQICVIDMPQPEFQAEALKDIALHLRCTVIASVVGGSGAVDALKSLGLCRTSPQHSEPPSPQLMHRSLVDSGLCVVQPPTALPQRSPSPSPVALALSGRFRVGPLMSEN